MGHIFGKSLGFSLSFCRFWSCFLNLVDRGDEGRQRSAEVFEQIQYPVELFLSIAGTALARQLSVAQPFLAHIQRTGSVTVVLRLQLLRLTVKPFADGGRGHITSPRQVRFGDFRTCSQVTNAHRVIEPIGKR